jgi:Putative peptidoglycan binding domain
MRSLLAATSILLVTVAAQAQSTPSSTAKPKQAPTALARPALQKPADTANAMAQAERQAIQSDLAWVGEYNGAITGDVSERMVEAIKEYQKLSGGKPTGVLNQKERSVLAETAKRRQDNAGWKIVTDATTGARLGIPTKLAPQQTSDAAGTRWSSPTGTIQILLSRRKEASPTAAKLAEREKKEPAGRSIDYSVVKPEFFVLSGLQGLKKFYVRGTFQGDEVRILTILYDQATENIVEPVVIAMSSAFNPFPVNAFPPPRRTVEYGTAVVASEDGAVVADRQITDGCLAIVIAGFGHADRLAEDKDHDLALLRVYGARGLKPLAIAAGNAPKNSSNSNLEITGIADPQNQAGRSAASNIKVTATSTGGGDLALSPAPGVGFSGAAARDDDGNFAGIALLKPLAVAGAGSTAAPAQAVLISADIVRDFLKTNGVSASGGSNDPKASVARVICVRK